MHYRQRIRDAVAAALTAANTGAGANVFTSRARPVLEVLQKRESVLSVYTADESAERMPDAYLSMRTLTVSIEGVAGGGDDLDDILDDLALQVEAAINADPTLDNLLHEELVLQSTSSEITARGNQQVGAFRMDFECGYLADRGVDAQLGPEPPLPTQVNISGVPVPDAYVWGSGSAVVQPPDIIPPTIDQDVVSPSRPPISPQQACEGGSCVPDAWQGDPQ